MAEGWVRHLKSGVIELYSAGIAPHGLDPRAVKVMAEAGVDISHQRSKHVNEFKDVEFDYVVTVCEPANENCPVFVGKAKKIHKGFDDPPTLARDAKNEDDALVHYRRVCEQIKRFVMELPGVLSDMTKAA